MVTDSSAESRKVDKKTASVLWDSAVLPPGFRKKRADEHEEENGVFDTDSQGMMHFTVVTKRGNKQQVIPPSFLCHSALTHRCQTRQLPIPAASALAVHTRSAQLQDKVEQQQLKRLVLDYKLREEAEEFKGQTLVLAFPSNVS
jgi:regulator of nonsense transcripts 2